MPERSAFRQAKLLRVTAPHFCAGALWLKIDGKWQCIEAAPILAWLRGRDAASVRDYFKAKGWHYEWIEPSRPRVILITGSRYWTNEALIRAVLEQLPRGSIVVHGHNPRGADAIADRIAQELGLEVRRYPADWDTHGKQAGPLRNQQMLDEQQPDEVHAFPLPDSRGTWDMVRRARAAGVPVHVHGENG